MVNKSKILVVVPARSGSKGLLDKNIKLFDNEPLVVRAIKQAYEIFEPKQVFLSTDSQNYLKIVKNNTNFKYNYLRPKKIAKDNSTNKDYLLDIIDYSENTLGLKFSWILILQCTSPLRKKTHIIEAIDSIEDKLDMVTSVHLTDSNPYYLHRLINKENNLVPLFAEKFTRRQDSPLVYELNGLFHLINISSLKKKNIEDFKNVKPVIIDKKYSIDIDDNLDFIIAEKLNEFIKYETF